MQGHKDNFYKDLKLKLNIRNCLSINILKYFIKDYRYKSFNLFYGKILSIKCIRNQSLFSLNAVQDQVYFIIFCFKFALKLSFFVLMVLKRQI